MYRNDYFDLTSRTKYPKTQVWNLTGTTFLDGARRFYLTGLINCDSLSGSRCLSLILQGKMMCPGKCRLCGHSNQTPEHFLVECPFVWQVWNMTMNRWIPHWQARPSTILRAFYAFALPPSPPHIDSYHVLDGVLAAVWKVYWRTIFDDVPFVPANVVVSVNKSL
ncbi:hypothetical protein PHYBLDRAFT_171161 [Phycomyces blakesleeanus NRRL 1555(-)]|uniref:Reverse transcriptase zinc-binding domain-containing protein n=1 Tax=Phycomyces blakesleeanus (strain ATCC 8743b / DSM 1359 / FGSC 10004 / NBRC 33097 / NRRL 1555) TaxID=763407 RepID=A0A167LGK6_PHYB8|nr:hypothetical protein PHYBLDRAFT_171161 [Phycomyces blakesleeanus NRRL 1555(-)]OAD70408.1 hypothetical protein PHYBLDRAFT_171161 [Phycomyces blakesleeanus NRRL 1555(-)]|eukprot:XP_018288448.1 hypothetical protein PHYBLDRAFT_171161 [Phycomyces blakesleeanus NRRL 1555(-)]